MFACGCKKITKMFCCFVCSDQQRPMKGQNKGVRARMLEINNCALYLQCGAHTWNVVISDTAKSSKYATDFFGLINRI